ncbi:uncharacterized protein LOC120249780 [Dioscorea cayenensis subsp. rotundata]|uniref:Uncharacterized protein LOC120249780 n=1 Tax=Dioscorea cayennensis subsp. rotundata TaxID=55577 RepID=A0AB40AHK4_DIOCR|nr:uncharacterized protein LOC120249780 [Dioscorea cayenensis subsp. rotundata]
MAMKAMRALMTVVGEALRKMLNVFQVQPCPGRVKSSPSHLIMFYRVKGCPTPYLAVLMTYPYLTLVRWGKWCVRASQLENAVGYVMGDQYYGAKANLNVWVPKVTSPSEVSLSQIWVISGSFGDDLNTIEVGWQTDAYQATRCYNLL